MKKILLALFSSLFIQQAIAQSNLVKFSSPISPSPTAANLGKYGDIPVSTYTGIPNILIPIYEIKMGSNVVPVNISYYAGGFKVADESSSVGLGWSLNAGGVITRAKKRKDDLSSIGYYKNSVHTNNDGTDKEPDIFYFNFVNFSGKFLIDYSSNPSQPYEIRRIGMYNDDDLKIILNADQTWLVIDKYGIKYEFKVTETQNEQAIPSDSNSSPIETSDYISSWYLSKIIYTNEEEVLFNYTQGAQIENIPIIDKTFGQGTGFVTSIPYTCYQPPFPRSSLSTTTYKVKVNTMDLSEIIFPSGKIEFNYLADRIDLKSIIGTAKRLTSIKIYNSLQSGYNLLKTFNFIQSYFTSSANTNYLSKRLRLDRLSEIGNIIGTPKNYDFLYNSYSLPDKDSKDIDHWGYYCGPRFNSLLFPTDALGNASETGTSRNPDINAVRSSLLSSIRYPSQLSTNFNYEINDFSNLGTNLFWSYANAYGNGMVGAGVRIKSIISIDNLNPNVPSLKKEFEYVSSDGMHSSGKIMSKINYSNPYDIAFNIGVLFGGCSQYSGGLVRELGKTLYSSSSIPINGDAQGSIIGYDRVVIKNVGASETTKSVDEYYNFSSASLNLYPRLPQSNNNNNGLLKTRTDYVKSGTTEIPLKQIEMTYTTKQSNLIKGYIYVASWVSNWMDLESYDIMSEWIVNSKTTERLFKDSQIVTKEVNLTYDNNNMQKTQEDYIDSKGDVYAFKYFYPKHMVTIGQIEPYQEMETRHMTGFNIQTEKYKNNVLLEKTYNDYARNWSKNNALILPSGIRTQYLNSTPENRLNYYAYDKRGNPITVAYQNGMKTTYLWSYNYQNPIAEIKNADISAIENILGTTAIDNFAALLDPDKTTVDNFIAPLYVGLPNALISTYVYSPLIGLVSQTDTKGLTSYYEYDGYQRLQLIKNQNGHIVKSYKYNYAPRIYYSVRREQEFTKTDCPSGSFSVPISFVVPEGQFTSIISQADADLQAENYMNANGESYANANGQCVTSAQYSVSYTVDPYFAFVNYTLTKSFDDSKRALCKVRIRYDPLSGGGATMAEIIEEVQMENGVLEYSNFVQINAATTVEVEIIEIIEN